MSKQNNIKELMLSSALYASSSILGPLLIFGGMGYMIDLYYKTNPWVCLSGVLIAFVVTNVLIFKKISLLTKEMDKYAPQKKNEEEGDNKI